MVGLVNPFLGVFALRMGASEYELGLLTSLPALTSLISQVPGAYMVNRSSSRLRVSLQTTLIHRLSFLVYLIVPFFGPKRALIFVLVVAAGNFFANASGLAWTSLMGDLFPTHLRSRIFSDRNMVLGFVTMAASMVAGPVLDSIREPLNFQVLFFASFVALMLSYWAQSKLVEPNRVPALRSEVSRSHVSYAAAFKDKPFVWFTVSLLIMHTGFNVSASMWTLLYVNRLNLSNSWISAISIISGLASALTYRMWGRWTQKFGNMLMLLAACAVFMPQPVLHVWVNSAWPLVPLNLASGFGGAGFNLAQFNALFEISTPESVPTYLALFNTVVYTTAFISPIVGVFLYRAISMNFVFTLSTIIRALSLVVFGVTILWARRKKVKGYVITAA